MTITREQIEMYASAADATQTFEMDKGKLIAVEPEHMQELARIALASLEAEAVAPDDVSGPLAYAYKELTPTFMRNHIDVFERYGIYPDGSAGIQAMRIALDCMNRRAAMQGKAEPGNSPAIPDGWVMVPAEPTAEMLQSGISAHYDRSQIQIHDRPTPGPMECAYLAMVLAEPQQEAKNV